MRCLSTGGRRIRPHGTCRTLITGRVLMPVQPSSATVGAALCVTIAIPRKTSELDPQFWLHRFRR